MADAERTSGRVHRSRACSGICQHSVVSCITLRRRFSGVCFFSRQICLLRKGGGVSFYFFGHFFRFCAQQQTKRPYEIELYIENLWKCQQGHDCSTAIPSTYFVLFILHLSILKHKTMFFCLPLWHYCQFQSCTPPPPTPNTCALVFPLTQSTFCTISSMSQLDIFFFLHGPIGIA